MVDDLGGVSMRGAGRWILAAASGALLALGGNATAAAAPRGTADAIVQFAPGVSPAAQRQAVRTAGGRVTRDLHLINGLGVRGGTSRLRSAPGVRAVTRNGAMQPTAAVPTRLAPWNPGALATAFIQSTRTDLAWTNARTPGTGMGVAVAVIDTGVAGALADFARPGDPAPRVVASAVVNPAATTAEDRYGHGTHVAGLIAGDGRALRTSDPLYNRYLGTAPEASIVSVKISDDEGNATIADAIDGLQFVADHGADYGVRVVNLSLGSTAPLPRMSDPLDAAVEAVWARGVVVVAAAGNRGKAADAVSYAPANDPYAITVGAVDDRGTKQVVDDVQAPWSSQGVTQDGVAKPDLVAPGAHIVAPLAPDSDFARMCPACIVDGRYFRLSGTSMAAPIVAGIAADLISTHPGWTPNEVKGALIATTRPIADKAREVDASRAINATAALRVSNDGLIPSPLVDASTGWLDTTRASWGRASWKSAPGDLAAGWGAESWTCDCQATAGTAETTRARWGRASWRAFFGETPPPASSPVP
jgi:serine protease AprX